MHRRSVYAFSPKRCLSFPFCSVTVHQFLGRKVSHRPAVGKTSRGQETSQHGGQKGQRYQGNHESGNEETKRRQSFVCIKKDTCCLLRLLSYFGLCIVQFRGSRVREITRAPCPSSATSLNRFSSVSAVFTLSSAAVESPTLNLLLISR